MNEVLESAPRTEVFGVRVYTYGIYCALGALAAAAVLWILCRATGKKQGTAALLTILCILFGTAGSRLFFCLLNHPGSNMVPLSGWLRISDGGLSLFGMILGAFFGAWICSKITGEKPCALLDITVCALPLVIAAERIGENMFDGFNVGRSVMNTFPAGTFLAVEDEFYGTSALAVWLLSAILAVILFIFLVFRLLRKNRGDGEQWIVFMLLCGAGGVVLESLRYDYHLEYSFVYFQQIIAALMLAWGVIAAGRRGKRKAMFTAAVISLIIAVAVCGGVEFALDRMNIPHILLYLIMIAALAVPVTLGILMTQSSERGTDCT